MGLAVCWALIITLQVPAQKGSKAFSHPVIKRSSPTCKSPSSPLSLSKALGPAKPWKFQHPDTYYLWSHSCFGFCGKGPCSSSRIKGVDNPLPFLHLRLTHSLLNLSLNSFSFALSTPLLPHSTLETPHPDTYTAIRPLWLTPTICHFSPAPGL